MSAPITEPEPGRELAPSDVRAESASLARIAGTVGLFLLTVGVVTVVARQSGAGLFPESIGYLLAVLGFTGLFVHASRDADLEVRRLYGLLAALLLVAAVVASLYPYKPEGADAGTVGGLLIPWGVGAGFLSLLFFVPFYRYETDDPYRTIVRYTLLGVGGLLTVGAVVGGLVKPDFLIGPGLVLALLGVGFLAAFLSNEDTGDGLGFWVAVGLGVVGAAALLVAVGRTVAPTVLFEGPDALKTPGQTYDRWKLAGRGLAVLAGLAVAAVALLRTAPLWLRGAAAVVGLSFAALMLTASFTKAGTQPPAPFLVPYGLLFAAIGTVYVAVSLAVVSDSPFVALTRRELAAYFYSPIAYLILFGVAGVAAIGYLYFYFIQLRGQGGALPEPIVERYMPFGILAAFQSVFLVPALTMRLFSEERRTGTLEVLLTAPVDEPVVVLSKFVSGWLFFMASWVPAALYLVALRVGTGVPFDYRPLLSYALALGASGAAFVALGLFFSCLTRNQVVAAVLTFASLMFLLLMVWSRQLLGAVPLPDALQWLQQVLLAVLGKLDFLSLWNQALSGQLPVRDVLIQLSIAVFWLFLTVKVLEARKWS